MEPPAGFDGAQARVVVVGAAGLILLALTIVVIAHPAPLPGEVGYVDWLQGFGEPIPSIARFARATTGTEAALLLTAPVGTWLIVRHRRAGSEAVAIALLAMLVVQPLFKDVVDRPRPTTADVEVRASASSESFPSGHGLSTTTVWGAAALVVSRRNRVVAVLLSAPVALTFLSGGVDGAHWPSDAVAGTLAGALAAVAIADRLRPTGTVRDRVVPPEEIRP